MDTKVREQTVDGATWDSVVSRGGVALAGLLAMAAIGLRDLEAAAMAIGAVVGMGLLRWRSGLLGKLGLALLAANVAFWMASGAVSNLTHGEGFWETALPSALTVAALLTLVGTVGSVVRRGARAVRALQVGAVAVLVAALVASALGIGGATTAQPGDLMLTMEDVRFGDTALDADAGGIGVLVANKDLFWHTFTIKELDVNLNVPVGAERRMTFNAPAGTYEFVCAIPGHTQAGMKGTLTVR